MAQRPHVPKFGNWESEENVPYTVYFDKARKGKSGGKMINPNDPQENPDMFPNASPSRTRPAPEEPAGRGSVKPAHDPRVSREDGGLRQVTDAPARNDNIARKTESSSTHQRQGGRGVGSGRTARQSAGSEYSIERSPLNPHARGMGRGSGSPAPEGKINSYDSSHGTPGRSRLRPARSESPDRGAAVPKFGDWDEKNPQAAETYTDIFNRVREERQTGGSANVPGTPKSPYNTTRKGKNVAGQSSTRCCFL